MVFYRGPNMNEGHYTSVLRDADDICWIADDSGIVHEHKGSLPYRQMIDKIQLNAELPYMLFYHLTKCDITKASGVRRRTLLEARVATGGEGKEMSSTSDQVIS